MSIIQGNAHTSAGGGYQIERSLRFNSADSAYLNRTFSTPTDGKRWTWSGWVKRGLLTNGTGTAQMLFSAGSATAFFRFSTTDTLLSGWTGAANLETTQVFRDASAWYHIILVVDTTQATASNRVKYYVNGSQITAFSDTDYPTQNSTTTINSAVAHNIGAYTSSTQYFNGYLTEVNFIDGQALTPSSFGETDTNTGVWKPKAYSGTYGTNGFYLKFADNSGTTSTTLGKDSSGNANNWTPNNFSVTAGSGNDSLVDTPTNYGTDTGAGGEVRGNYATLNPLQSNGTLTNGNLDYTTTVGGTQQVRGTFGMSSGKWYWEFRINTGAACDAIGIISINNFTLSDSPGLYSDGYAYTASGLKGNNANYVSYGASYTTGDTVGVALDMDAGTLTYYKNGVSQGTAYSSISGTFVVCNGDSSGGSGSNMSANFGQRPFAYTAPSGFKALCTQNLPTPTIGATSTTQANDYFDISLWTGTGASQTITNSGGFQPDFVWGKIRSGADYHVLTDAVRGNTKFLKSNTTDAEITQTQNITSFNSNGFTLGTNTDLNRSTYTFVGWQWKANGAGSTNTAGTITSTVSANTTSGFSIVTYTGNGSTGTVGHGLGVAPKMVIVKDRDDAGTNWCVYTEMTGNTNRLLLNLTNASAATGNWNNTSPTSTVFSIGTSTEVNASTKKHVAYCFAEVSGFSKAFSYTGNGSADGPFVFTNFRPRYLMIKRTDSAENWYVKDTARDSYNPTLNILIPNSSSAEIGNQQNTDFLSNGFKIRTTDGAINASGGTYIYMALAENPFKYSLAR